MGTEPKPLTARHAGSQALLRARRVLGAASSPVAPFDVVSVERVRGAAAFLAAARLPGADFVVAVVAGRLVRFELDLP